MYTVYIQIYSFGGGVEGKDACDEIEESLICYRNSNNNVHSAKNGEKKMNEHGLHNSNEATRTLLNKGHNRSFHLNFKNIFSRFRPLLVPHLTDLHYRFATNVYRRGQYFIHKIYY